jgi:hypothetical protein
MLTRACAFMADRRLAPYGDVGGALKGDIVAPVTARDLVDFGRCPRRWVLTDWPEDPVAELGPSLTEWLAVGPPNLGEEFVRRPDTYEAMVLRCPKCNSAGPAKVCRKCGVSRRHVVEPRPWSGAAKQCAAWTQKQEALGTRIVPAGEWDRALMGATTMRGDKAVEALIRSSDPLVTFTANWRDEPTGLEIPLLVPVTLVPREGTPMDHAIAVYVEVRNADPKAWEPSLTGSGVLVHAALALQVVNKALGQARRHVVWMVVEREAPRLTARRRAAAELLELGRTSLEALTAAYARCVKAGWWPNFEAAGGDTLDAWPESHVEPWMTAGMGADGGFFAPGAVRDLVQSAT